MGFQRSTTRVYVSFYPGVPPRGRGGRGEEEEGLPLETRFPWQLPPPVARGTSQAFSRPRAPGKEACGH